MTDARPLAEWPVWDLRVVEPADRRALLLALLAGVAVDVGIRAEVATIGGALAVLVVAGALVASGRLRTTASLVCVGFVALLAPFFVLRANSWLVGLDVLAAFGAVALAGVLGRDGRLDRLPARVLASRLFVAIGHGIGAASFLWSPLRGLLVRRARSSSALAVGRGIALALPIVVVLGALLASADAVFASLFSVRVSAPEDAIAHMALVLVGALAFGAVLRTASASAEPVPAVERRLGVVEWTIVLGSVVALFAGFAATQVVALAGGADHVLETDGLTYAEYARSGYWQLLAVTALTALVLALLRAFAIVPAARARRFTVLNEVVVALTGVVLLVAARRLALYEDAYGWTVLRFLVKASMVWLGLVLALTAGRIAGVARDRDWLLSAVIGAGALVLVVMNVVNPDGLVARHGVRDVETLDPAYITSLSDDAVPAIVEGLPSLPADVRRELTMLLCASPVAQTVERDDDGFLQWNAANARAADALDEVC